MGNSQYVGALARPGARGNKSGIGGEGAVQGRPMGSQATAREERRVCEKNSQTVFPLSVVRCAACGRWKENLAALCVQWGLPPFLFDPGTNI